MREICLSGSMSGERKRSVAEWPKLPRLSPTLPFASILAYPGHVRYSPHRDRKADIAGCPLGANGGFASATIHALGFEYRSGI